MACCSPSRFAGLTCGEPCRTRETRDFDTPARFATVRMVAGRAGPGSVTSASFTLGPVHLSGQRCMCGCGQAGGGAGPVVRVAPVVGWYPLTAARHDCHDVRTFGPVH